MAPINIITVLCDPRRMKTIAINCRCGNRWTERIPEELHESSMGALFVCTKCQREHILKDKQLKSYDKGAFNHDGSSQAFAGLAAGDKPKYDA